MPDRAGAPSVVVDVAGVPVRVRSVAPAVLAFAEEKFPRANATSTPLAMLEVLPDSAPRGGRDARAEWSLRRDELVLRVMGLEAIIHLDRAEGLVTIDVAALTRASDVRRALEGAVLSLVNRLDRHPIHAATLRTDDSALVLHGPSGVGKSTLAWEAHRAGIGVLSDDATRVQLSPELRVWGDGTPPRIHLLDDVRNRYDDLRQLSAESLGADNAPKVTVELRATQEWVPYARNPRVVLLSRSNAREVSVTAATSAEIFAALMSAPEAEMDLSPANRERVLRALASPGGYRMELTQSASDAIPHVRRLLSVPTGEGS